MASCAFNKRIHTPFEDTNMHANDIAFGIELETTMSATDTTPIGGYHNGLPVAWLPAGWKAERDSSIQTLALNRKGCEFVSPVLLERTGESPIPVGKREENMR
jgi:hypothetical protein